MSGDIKWKKFSAVSEIKLLELQSVGRRKKKLISISLMLYHALFLGPGSFTRIGGLSSLAK